MAPTQQKALVVPQKLAEFTLLDVPVPKPGKDEVLVKIHSSALNPVDWKIRKWGIFLDEKDYPLILGGDIAGEVVSLGEGVSQVAIGDRVLTQGVMANNEQSGFQQYATVDVHTLAKIPGNLTYDDAATIPLAITAPYVGLYNASPYGLGFDAPAKVENRGKYHGTPFFIFGGSTAIGHFALQLARLSGFSPIITTASPKYEADLKALGATHVLDRNKAVTEAQLKEISSSPIKHIFDGISTPETQKQGFRILAPGGTQIVVLEPEPFWEQDGKEQNKTALHVLGKKALPEHHGLLVELYRNLTKLLEDGDLKRHSVEIVPGGLNGIEEGLRKLEEGRVHNAKLVVHPQETI